MKWFFRRCRNIHQKNHTWNKAESCEIIIGYSKGLILSIETSTAFLCSAVATGWFGSPTLQWCLSSSEAKMEHSEYRITSYLCEIMRIKTEITQIIIICIINMYSSIATSHVKPCINKIWKLPFFLAKTHKFLSRINNWLYGTSQQST